MENVRGDTPEDTKEGPGSGRHSEYDPAYVEKAKEYLAGCIDSFTGDEKKVRLPSIEGLARYLEVSRPSIYKWKGEQPLFSYILEQILAEQATRLMNNGLSGVYTPTISKLILTKHGYSDRTETDITSKNEKIGMTDEQVAKMDAFLSALRPQE